MLGLGAIFVLVIIVIRLASLAALARAVSDRVPFLLVEPDTPGNFWIVVSLLIAPLVFLLPRARRMSAGAFLLLGSLAVVGISGNSMAPGGSGTAHTPVAHWLHSQGYARCAAGDRVRSGLHSIGVAEGWAQPGACLPPFDSSDDLH